MRDHIDNASELLSRYARGERDFRWDPPVVGYLQFRDVGDPEPAELASFLENRGGVHIAGAHLSHAQLSGADLAGGSLVRAELNAANLTGTDLSGADLTCSELRSATAEGARLVGTKLAGANLAAMNLRGANLAEADLVEANLSAADLSGASLVGADLTATNLTGANLEGADLSNARLLLTNLADVDLAAFCRASVRHVGRCTVNHRTVVRSLRQPNLAAFLRSVGVPDVFVEYMIDCARSLDPEQIFSLLQSTFISYGGPDEPFARKLSDALKAAGVTTFLFVDDAPPGERLHRVMRRGVNDHDRVILICSRSSLERRGVLNELEETLAREARDGGNQYLIPVRLDDHVVVGWEPRERMDLAQAVRDRVIADFTRHGDEAEFRRELGKLIRVLKKKSPNPIVEVVK